MTAHEATRRAWLDAARRELAPSRQRVDALRGRLRESIQAGAAPSFEAPGAQEPPGDTTLPREGVRRASSQQGTLQKLLASKLSKWLAISVAGGLTFAAGHQIGWRRAARQADTVPSSSDEIRAAMQSAAEPIHDVSAAPVPRSPGGQRAAEVSAVGPNASLPAAGEPLSPVESRAGAGTHAKTVPPRLGAPTRAAPASRPLEHAAPDLASEIAFLQNAQRALRQNRPDRAREWIAELDEKHPAGALREERAAVAALAACQSDSNDAAARARGEAFLEVYPESGYAERVRTECALGPVTDSSAFGDISIGGQGPR